MAEPTIICPKCRAEIKLTESLAAPLLEATRKDFERQLAEKNEFFAEKDKSLRIREEAISKERESLDASVEEKMKLVQARIAKEEARKAKEALATDIEEKDKKVSELEQTLKKREDKLAEAQKAQANFLQKQRELEDEKREIDLTIEKRVQESIGAARDQSRKEAEEQLKYKIMEKEETITSMQRQIETLKQKAEQGSQQLQGEVQEIELENLLKAKFPYDSIEPVPKGEHGGDVLQRVVSPLGHLSGTIIWESKRTKSWSDSWLQKLREDQRTVKAEIAVIVSQILPKDIDTFGLVDGVWVTHPKSALPVALILRQALIDVATTRLASEGQQTKMELVYQYLTGPRFRQRVQAIVEAFSSMNEDLDREKKAIMKQWAKREEQIDRVMQSTVGMYGDLQGIAGKSLQEIKGLSFLELGEDSQNNRSNDK